MSECKYSKCSNLALGDGDYCSHSHRAMASRERNKKASATPDKAQHLDAQQQGATATPDKGSSSTGDPQARESGEKTIVTDFPHKIVDPGPI